MKPNADKNSVKQQKLFEWYEIAGFFVIVMAVLLLLFPEDKILQLLKKETSNNTLTIQYIENIRKFYKADYRFLFLLVEKYLQSGEIEKARKVIDDLKENYFDTETKKILLLEYNLEKTKYFSSRKDRDKTRKNLKKILYTFYKNAEKKEDYRFVYKEALSFSFFDIAMKAVERLIESGNKIFWLNQAASIALQNSDFNKSEEFYKELLKIDPKNRKKYLKRLASLMVQTSKHKRATEYYEKLAALDREKSLLWYEKGALTALAGGLYGKASKLYIEAMKQSKKGARKIYFLKALNSLLSGNRTKMAANLIKRYGMEFANDKETAKSMIKAALGAGETKLARKISVKLMEKY
ncbi:tetratricopeptide repeat protein [Nitrosophilus alvini]|uniref:tetratricopeptide repeat protein n=1 Tax=Nitrosophilus alvini TaxID=2714855 RepID=UPI00190D4022|nr:hypothetical protein [Nitrosophilus alvini]